jgi:hypothetical protein
MKRLLILILVFTGFVFAQNENKIKINDPWIRNATKGMNTGMFVKIENISDKDDYLIGVECKFAEVSEIHEVFKQGDMMGMRSVEKLLVKAKSSLVLKPRDYHIMFLKLTEDLKIGDKKEVTLKFKNAGSIKVNVPVKEMQNRNR